MSKKRADGRKPDEMRPTEIEVGVIKEADGSAMVKMGKTVAVAAVYGPRTLHPRRLRETQRAVLRCYYNMIPFSTEERVRPGHSRRSTEIAKVTRQALEPVMFLEDFPKAGIDVVIEVLQADSGTRTAGINAASVALADAGVPMRDLVASVAVGKIGKDYIIDLAGGEEDKSECDIPVAYVPNRKQVTLLQMDGDVSKDDFKKMLEIAIKGCEEIYKKQKQALEKKWVGEKK